MIISLVYYLAYITSHHIFIFIFILRGVGFVFDLPSSIFVYWFIDLFGWSKVNQTIMLDA